MENTSGFVLGLLAMITSIVLLFIPYMTTSPILGMLGVLCVIININMCILIMMGGIWNSKGLSGTGFGVGMGTWIGFIFIMVLSIIGIQQSIASETFFLILIILIDPYFLFVITQISYISLLTRALTWDIVNIIVMGVCLIFGSISFGLVSQEKF